MREIIIFNHAFLYTAFADGSTFFLNDLLSVKNLSDIFKVFSLFWGLKVNISKCEIAGPGSLKGVLEAVCVNRHYQNFRCSFFIQQHSFQNFLDTVKSIQQVLCFWNSRMLSLEGRIIIFKTLAISKIFYLTYFFHSNLIDRRTS